MIQMKTVAGVRPLPVARDGSRAETEETQTERREERGTFWMKTNVKTIKAIFPLINSPLWLLGLLSLSVPIQLQMDERLGVSGCNWIWIRWPRKHQDWCTMSLMEREREKRKRQWILKFESIEWTLDCEVTTGKLCLQMIKFHDQKLHFQSSLRFTFLLKSDKKWQIEFGTQFLFGKYWYFSRLEMCLWLVFGFLSFFHIQMQPRLMFLVTRSHL